MKGTRRGIRVTPITEDEECDFFEDDTVKFPETLPMDGMPTEDTVNIVSDNNNQASDAATAVKALLGEGGDFRADSELDDGDIRALFVLLDVAEAMNCPRLVESATNFCRLRISKGRGSRKETVAAFRGLFEPTTQPGQEGMNMPNGMMRGRI
jgi:hypothetical protein